MSRSRRTLYCVLVAGAVSVTSCVHPPAAVETPSPPAPAAPAPPEPLAEPPTPSDFELHRRAQAHTLAEQGRWAEAAAEWEILTLLRPDVAEYRNGLRDARTRIDTNVSERLRSAADARQRGDADRAQTLYLKVLSLDPDNTIAAQALRDIEADRMRRSRPPRPAVVARIEKAPQARAAAEPSAAAPERRDLDFANMLLRQGEYLASIKLLENYVKSYPKDELARRHLAEAYVQLGHQRLQQGRKEEAVTNLEKATRVRGSDAQDVTGTLASLRKALAEESYQNGLRVQAVDISQAIVHWERAVRYDPSHVNASARLQQARQMERNLRTIENSGVRR